MVKNPNLITKWDKMKIINNNQIKLIITLIFLILLIQILSGCISNANSSKLDFNSKNVKTGDYLRFILYDFRIRSYRIHIPSSYNDNTQVSLVLALHGGGGRSKNMLSKTGFNQKSDEEGFIVVYPNGISRILPIRTWNAGFCCGQALEKNIDDVGFIEKLIDKLEGEYNIDSNRIYITGHSNGGMMSYRLGSQLSEKIAAIAPVAGSIGGYETNESELWTVSASKYPVSVIAIHGKLDENVPYYGGRGNNTGGTRSYLSVNESIEFWVINNNCIAFPERNISNDGNIIIDSYHGGQNLTEVSLVTIINGGHEWPGSNNDPIQSLNATNIIWDFFESHPKQ
jgi:polyhydroxybutyrate depolymerase